MRIPPPPSGYVYTGSVNVPVTNNGTWTLTIGSQPWGQFLASAPYGPVQAYSAEDIVVAGTGLTPGTAYQFVFIGSIDDERTATPVAPMALVTAVNINNAPTVNVSSIGTVGSISNPVTVGSISNSVTVGSVSQPISLASGTVVAIATGTNSIGTVNLASGSTVTLASGGNNIGIISLASGSSVGITGAVTVNGTVSIAAGSAAIGTVSLSAGSAVNITSGTVNIGTVSGNVGVVNPSGSSLAVQRPEALWGTLTFNASSTQNVGPPGGSVPVSDLMLVQITGGACTIEVVGHNSGVVYLPTTAYNANGIPTHIPFSPALDSSVDITCTVTGLGAGGPPVFKVVGRVYPSTVTPVSRTGAPGPTSHATANLVLNGTGGTLNAAITDVYTSVGLGGYNGAVVRIWSVEIAARSGTGGGYAYIGIGNASPGSTIGICSVGTGSDGGQLDKQYEGGLPVQCGLNALTLSTTPQIEAFCTVAYSIDS
jgi:hypothetical protein